MQFLSWDGFKHPSGAEDQLPSHQPHTLIMPLGKLDGIIGRIQTPKCPLLLPFQGYSRIFSTYDALNSETFTFLLSDRDNFLLGNIKKKIPSLLYKKYQKLLKYTIKLQKVNLSYHQIPEGICCMVKATLKSIE